MNLIIILPHSSFCIPQLCSKQMEKITLHAPGDKFLRYLCKHQLSLHLNISGLEAWVVLCYMCEMFGYRFIPYFDTGSGRTDQKHRWVCLCIQTTGSKQHEDN